MSAFRSWTDHPFASQLPLSADTDPRPGEGLWSWRKDDDAAAGRKETFPCRVGATRTIIGVHRQTHGLTQQHANRAAPSLALWKFHVHIASELQRTSGSSRPFEIWSLNPFQRSWLCCLFAKLSWMNDLTHGASTSSSIKEGVEGAWDTFPQREQSP